MTCHSKIEWTECTWNPVTGCTKVSEGCRNCYAERMAHRLKAMGQRNYVNGFRLTVHEHLMTAPFKWKRPQMVFVNSMSDLFHEEVPLDFIYQVFEVMRQADMHTFQILTKRSERLREINHMLSWPNNVWMGVTVENANYSSRVDDLRSTGAKTKFLSIEPMLGPIPGLDLHCIDWVIVGGESGPKAREMNPRWVRQIRDDCKGVGIPFFFKQWGGVNKKKAGRELDGQTWDEMPTPADQRNNGKRNPPSRAMP